MTEATFQSRDGTPIHYRIEGSGPTVVLVHGVGANLASWDAIAQTLAQSFRVIRANLRGHGKSGRITQCSIDDFIDDLQSLLETTDATDVSLVGFSLGGLIAQHFALAHPERLKRLVLISSVAERTPEERERVLKRADIVKKEGIASVVAAAKGRWFTDAFAAANPDKVARRLTDLQANDHASYAAAYYVFAEADQGLPFEKIKIPTLVMTGENDIGSSPRMARLLHERIAHSQLIILPKLKHSVLIEAPDQISSLILTFFGSKQAA